jgi:hypothetical protein
LGSVQSLAHVALHGSREGLEVSPR